MEPERAKDFMDLMGRVSEVYGRDKPTTQAMALYLILLDRFPYESIRQALLNHMATSRFFPVPADLIILLEGTVEDRASMAWGNVLKAISKAGGWNRVQFEDPCIAPCLEALGGWGHLCATLTRDREHAVEKAFSAQYRRYAGKAFCSGPTGSSALPKGGSTMEQTSGRVYSVSKNGTIVEIEGDPFPALAAHISPGGVNRDDFALHDGHGGL